MEGVGEIALLFLFIAFIFLALLMSVRAAISSGAASRPEYAAHLLRNTSFENSLLVAYRRLVITVATKGAKTVDQFLNLYLRVMQLDLVVAFIVYVGHFSINCIDFSTCALVCGHE